jgi:iron(III) transport system substrate-binding protein
MSRIVSAAVAIVVCVISAHAQVPPGYPADYGKIIEAANKEGRLVLYTNTDSFAAGMLLKDFAELYPRIRVDYTDLNSGELRDRFLAESAAGTDTADLLWSSSMDLQVKLAVDGHAATYASPEIPSLPKWAVWQNQAYGTTYEPVTMVYSKRLMPAAEVPQDHAALLALLNAKPAAYKGKVTAYDPEKSGVGYLFANEDIKNYPQAWDLFRAFGKTSIKLYGNASAMLEGVTAGEHTIAYGIFGSYALARARKVPDLGVILPTDYTLVTSRVAFVTAKARRPNAARLFLDYLLSQRGQDVIANQADLYSLRDDVTGEMTLRHVTDLIGDKARPVPISRDLLAKLSEAHRREFAQKWQAAMKGQ